MKPVDILLIAILCVLLCFIFVPTGTGSAPTTDMAEDVGISIGFAQVGSESDWRIANTVSMAETFTKEKGYAYYYNDPRQRQYKQYIAVREFIQQGVDYIVLAPMTEPDWEPLLREVQSAGIPIIILDRQIQVSSDELFDYWIGSDFRKEADVAMEWLQDELAKQGTTETVDILHLQGTQNSTAQIHRSAGLEAAVEAEETWCITEQLQGDFTEAKGYELMKDYLAAGKSMDVLYCENDSMALGTIRAMEELEFPMAETEMLS